MSSIQRSKHNRSPDRPAPPASWPTLQTEEQTTPIKRSRWERGRRVGDRTTGSASRYWQLMRLMASGHMQRVDRPEAKAFFEYRIYPAQAEVQPSNEESLTLSDQAIQKQAWSVVQDPNDGDRTVALSSLRCFVSYGVVQVCRQLVAQFGAEHGFALEDLLPYVLDDHGEPLHPDKLEQHYLALSIQILQSFDPNRASLSTWVSRRVKRHPELNRFLLQQGVYLVSDWAILNDTNSAQLQRILTEFHGLSQHEIIQSLSLLQNYHNVYRRDRLQQVAERQVGRSGACLPPTTEQLQRIADANHSTIIQTPEQVLYDLRNLAALLRQYRIHVRGGSLPTESLDQPESPALSVSHSESESESTSNEFLTQFRQQFVESLDEAIAEVVSDRLKVLTRRKKGDPDGFLKGLHLFHCDGMSMAEVADVLELKAQYQVTRLLKLKDFRADVRHGALVRLGDRLRMLAATFASPDQVHQADAQIEAALSDQVDALMTTAEAEASSSRPCPMTNLFAQRLCRYLQTRSKES